MPNKTGPNVQLDVTEKAFRKGIYRYVVPDITDSRNADCGQVDVSRAERQILVINGIYIILLIIAFNTQKYYTNILNMFKYSVH